MNITCGFGCDWTLELKQKHSTCRPPFFQIRKEPCCCKFPSPKISTEPSPWILFPTRSWVQNEIWDFSETLLGAKNGKHFSLGKNVCVAGKNMAGLARHEQGQQSLQENDLMQSHGAMAFSEELCPLVSLHCFAFWERQLHYYRQGSFKSASLSRLRR